MDRYTDIKQRIIEAAARDDAIKAIIAIGSSTREEPAADEYSDLDLIIVTADPAPWYSGEYPKQFGDVKISFIEPTLGGGRERRCIYDADRDVDMIIFTPAQFDEALKAGVAGWVMNRGYTVLYSAADVAGEIEAHVTRGHSSPTISAEEFENLVNDFYFHNIWAKKKLLRGELWSAKMCVDAYLKNHLLRAIEWYCAEFEGKDVWHDGRFLDTWAGEHITGELSTCFAHYDRTDVLRALRSTHRLFEEITRELAGKKGFMYPNNAAQCAKTYLDSELT